MSYWKGLMFAAAIDLAWISGCPLATAPDTPRAVSPVEQITAIGDVEDSLMTHLQAHPEDVTAMERVARLYMWQGWYEPALRPLARAVELEPSRRSLWVLLDEAIEKTGRGSISDAELVQKALEFKEAVEMWGGGC